MGRFIGGKTINDWGNYVYVKANAPDLLKMQIERMNDSGKDREVLISSVTDPYQGVEAKYKLTRQCLKILAQNHFQGLISILTKSDLVLRDIDVIKQIENCIVGITITSTNDSISRYFERYAPPSSKRIDALKKLNKQGIDTYAFVGPLLPHFASQKERLDDLFKAIAQTGTQKLYVEHLNLSPYIKGRLKRHMKKTNREILEKFYNSQSEEYRKDLDEIVYRLIRKYEFTLLEDIIFHKNNS